MATIVKRPRKNGIAYLFQIKITDPLTSKVKTKSITWHPSKGYTAKQIEREAAIAASEWEAKIKALYNVSSLKGELSPDSTFKEVSDKWLEKIAINESLNHLEASKNYLGVILPKIGDIKIGKLTQHIIQSLFDWIDTREKVIRTVRSKPDEVRAAIKASGETYTTLVRKHKLNDCTLSFVLNGKSNVSLEYAKRFTNIVKAEINLLFDIQEKRELYSYNTNHHIKGTVRTILSFAKKRRIVIDNYATAEYIDYPKRNQNEIVCMDQEEIKQAYKVIIEYDGDIRYSTMLLTVLLTGLRRGELCGLKWENIDLANQLITINKSITRVKNHGVIIKEPKTKKSTRIIQTSLVLAEQLRKYKKWYYEKKAELSSVWDENDWVFVNIQTGNRIAPDTISQWLNKVTEKAGLGYWSVHSYRHTNITTKLLNNVPLLEVSGDAGHSRTSTTTDRYGHYLANHKRVGPSVFDKLVTEDMQKEKDYLN